MIAVVRLAVESEKAYDKMLEELLVKMISKLLPQDPFTVALWWRLATFKENDGNWDNADGILRHCGKIYLSKRVYSDILTQFHDNLLAGYFGIKKTLHLL